MIKKTRPDIGLSSVIIGGAGEGRRDKASGKIEREKERKGGREGGNYYQEKRGGNEEEGDGKESRREKKDKDRE